MGPDDLSDEEFKSRLLDAIESIAANLQKLAHPQYIVGVNDDTNIADLMARMRQNGVISAVEKPQRTMAEFIAAPCACGDVAVTRANPSITTGDGVVHHRGECRET